VSKGRPPAPVEVRRSHRVLRWIGRHEWSFLVLLALIACGIWGFAELADEVLEGETHAFDTAVLLALRTPGNPDDPLGPRWFEEMVRDYTALGGIGVLAFVTLAACGYLLLQGQYRACVLLGVTTFGGGVLSTLLKLGFARPRPALVAHQTYTVTSSFPSGHALVAAVTYLTLGVLLARVQPNLLLKAYLLLLSVLLTVAIGLSRVYLGVHWPTDVLAGWTGGAVWALCCWLVARGLQRRGKIEGEIPPPAAGQERNGPTVRGR
jgi:undecaprenyl-diphosphatase